MNHFERERGPGAGGAFCKGGLVALILTSEGGDLSVTRNQSLI